MVKKTAGAGPRKRKEALKKSNSKTLEANWSGSHMTQLKLKRLEETRVLPPQSKIVWHALGKETRPKPQEGEVIVFADHITWGFRPPGSSFLWNSCLLMTYTPKILHPTPS